MRKLRNRVAELAAVKGRKENRTITQRDLAEEIGIPLPTVARWHRNEVSRIDEHIVLKITSYFGVSVGELLIVEETAEGEESPERKNPTTEELEQAA